MKIMTDTTKFQNPKLSRLILSQKDWSFFNVLGFIKLSTIMIPKRATKHIQGRNHPPPFSSSISPNSFPQCGHSKRPGTPSSNSSSRLQCGHWMTTIHGAPQNFPYKRMAGSRLTKGLLSSIFPRVLFMHRPKVHPSVSSVASVASSNMRASRGTPNIA